MSFPHYSSTENIKQEPKPDPTDPIVVVLGSFKLWMQQVGIRTENIRTTQGVAVVGGALLQASMKYEMQFRKSNRSMNGNTQTAKHCITLYLLFHLSLCEQLQAKQ